MLKFCCVNFIIFRCENLSDGQRCLLVKCATMTMYDIPSVEKNGQTLGSLMFSESFLDSVLRVKGEGQYFIAFNSCQMLENN